MRFGCCFACLRNLHQLRPLYTGTFAAYLLAYFLCVIRVICVKNVRRDLALVALHRVWKPGIGFHWQRIEYITTSSVLTCRVLHGTL